MFFQAILLFLLSLFISADSLLAPIHCSGRQSLLVLGENSKIITTSDILGFSGTVTLSSGASIEGSNIVFSNGTLGDRLEDTVQISGYFSVDTTSGPLVNSSFGNSPVDFLGENFVRIHADTVLNSTWNFSSDTTIEGRYNFNLADPNALLIVQPGVTLHIEGLTLDQFVMEKLILVDSTSTVKFIDTSVILAADLTSSVGNMVIEGSSGFVMNHHDVLFSNSATFTVALGASFWLDTRGSTVAPIFSFVVSDTASPSGTKLVSAVDNTFVRISADVGQIVDPGVSSLTSGTVQPHQDPTNPDPGAGTTVVVSNNSVVSPTEQIVVTDNVEIQGAGSSITFSNNSKNSQLVIASGKTATFSDVELLRINQNTFDLQADSTIRFTNNMVLEYVEDVIYDRGVFLVTGNNSQILMRGLGGVKRITFKTSAEGFSPIFNLGTNKLILEDVEIIGLHYFSRNSAIVNGDLYDGKMVLVGQTRVNIIKDTDMYFLIRGNGGRLVLQENNLILNGQIRFDDFIDSQLTISFTKNSDTNNLAFALGSGVMRLGCKEAQSGLVIANDIVTIINLAGSSFITSGNTFLGGGVLKIAQNPINQESIGFSLLPGLDLQTELPFPINFAQSIRGNRNSCEWAENNLLFCDESFRRALPTPNLVVRTGITGSNLRNTIAVRPGGIINSLSPSKTDPLNLVMVGNAKAKTAIRRSGQVASIARATSTSVVVDAFDTFKPTDTIYVTGINNVITVTGLLAYQGNIVLDSGAELIFSFDESVDIPKAINFSNPNGGSSIIIPATASIVFEGNGSVFFDKSMFVSFLGTSFSQQQLLGNGLFKDDRPSLIFRNYAQFIVDDPLAAIIFSGNGKVLFQNGSQLLIEAGQVLIGQAVGNFFDLTLDKNSEVIVGLSDPDIASSSAILSLAKGTFNLSFDRGSGMSIKNGGLIELGLIRNIYSFGQMNSMVFDRNSYLKIQDGGILSIGQKSLSVVDNNDEKFFWNNLDGQVSGSGIVRIVLQNSTSPFVSATLQSHNFKSKSDGISPFELFKGLAKKTNDLITASDFVDSIDGLSKLITNNNIIVSLADGDIVRREGAGTGNVYGTSASGQSFYITPEGIKTFF